MGGRRATVFVPILAPQRTVTVGVQAGDFAVTNVYANRITLKGSTVYDTLGYLCP